MEKYYNVPVTLNVTFAQASMLIQLVAKLPLEQSLELYKLLEETLRPIALDIQAKIDAEQQVNQEKENGNEDTLKKSYPKPTK